MEALAILLECDVFVWWGSEAVELEDGRLKNVGGLGEGVDGAQVNLVPSALDARSSSELIDFGEGNVFY